MPTQHSWETSADSLTVEYRWQKARWHSLKVVADRNATPLQPGSEEEFITEHYWGYTKVQDTITSEYQVEHPRWQIYAVRDYAVDVDFGNVYGEEFGFLTNEKPISVFLAEGSEITVNSGSRI